MDVPREKRGRARSGSVVTQTAPGGDNTPQNLPSLEARVQRLLQEVTQKRVLLLDVLNHTRETEFVLSPTSLDHAPALAAAVRVQLRAPWALEERVCDLPVQGRPVDDREPQRTLVLTRAPLHALRRPVWKTLALELGDLGLVAGALAALSYLVWVVRPMTYVKRHTIAHVYQTKVSLVQGGSDWPVQHAAHGYGRRWAQRRRSV